MSCTKAKWSSLIIHVVEETQEDALQMRWIEDIDDSELGHTFIKLTQTMSKMAANEMPGYSHVAYSLNFYPLEVENS